MRTRVIVEGPSDEDCFTILFAKAGLTDVDVKSVGRSGLAGNTALLMPAVVRGAYDGARLEGIERLVILKDSDGRDVATMESLYQPVRSVFARGESLDTLWLDGSTESLLLGDWVGVSRALGRSGTPAPAEPTPAKVVFEWLKIGPTEDFGAFRQRMRRPVQFRPTVDIPRVAREIDVARLAERSDWTRLVGAIRAE